MSKVINFANREAWDDRYVAAILAEINAPRAERAASARAERNLNALVYEWPTPQAVAELVRSHGWAHARERWGFVRPDELCRRAARGGLRAVEVVEEDGL